MRRTWLLRLYPRAWRERYGEEFLATVGDGPVRLQQVIDIVAGAIDARLSADVRRTTMASRVAPTGGGSMWLKSLMACEQQQMRYTRRDSLLGAGVMAGASLFLVVLGTTARRGGFPVAGEVLIDVAFPVSLMLSMPFWMMKGQPRKAQIAIVGGTLVILVLMGVLSAAT